MAIRPSAPASSGPVKGSIDSAVDFPTTIIAENACVGLGDGQAGAFGCKKTIQIEIWIGFCVARQGERLLGGH